MPYRRTYRRKYTPKRRYWRKKYSRKRPYYNMRGKVYVKLRVTATVSSNPGGQIIINYTNNPSSLQDWTSISNLYDEYCVKAMAFKFIPFLPNDTSTTTGFFPLYSVIDQNSGSGILGSINDAIQYENMRVFNMYRPWKLYRRFSKVTGNSITIVNNGYMPTASPTATAVCSFYGEGFDISQSYGTIIVTAYITARNRK